MFYGKGADFNVSAPEHVAASSVGFAQYDVKWKRGDDQKAAHDFGKTGRADQCHFFGSSLIAHRQKESGKSGDMVGVAVCQADRIDRFQAELRFTHRDLCSFTAVYQYGVAFADSVEGCQPSVF
jgi:hypothetical protein